MKLTKILNRVFLVLAVVAFVSCEDQLTELNVNPNGVDPETVQPNLMLATVISNTATSYCGFDCDVAGVMQYVQKSGWGSGLNKYDWVGERGWGYLYGNLRNDKHLYERSVEEGMEFQQGVAIVLRAFTYGFIADHWGDAPYTAALNGATGEQEDMFPVFDSQETIYRGIIEELKIASSLLSKSASAYIGIDPNADVMYGGDPEMWRKMSNSLRLRYYMRVSTKLPSFAQAGIEEIVSDPGTYPVFTSEEEDATMGYIGSSEADSWPNAIAFDASESNFNRVQLCAGFRDVLVDLNDPRLAVWFNKVRIPIKVSTAYTPEADIVEDGIRYLHPDSMDVKGWVVYNQETWPADIEDGKVLVDTNDYAGMPIASSTGDGSGWNLNPNVIQGGPNVHNSALADMYKEAKGDLLRQRLISYAEVCFIIAEAAQKGWSVGSQQEWYEKGVEASFNTWGTSDDAADYLDGTGVTYDGSLEQIMVQKWIANWTVAHESYCDWRRTGYPALTIGPIATRDAIPLRFMYGNNEKNRNNTNYLDAISNLVETDFTAQDGEDSSWSKFWLLQGTGNPY
ncbi:MAG: SusD/RagB family nutrient-binding outer membrane lipoprotein [Bacteroidales bacterium]|nr:SusD/RagB family nutrient-binding outer membrane lipoprotein [Bacteroidales bacterium]